MLAEVVLAIGTKAITIREIAQKFALAIHPNSGDKRRKSESLWLGKIASDIYEGRLTARSPDTLLPIIPNLRPIPCENNIRGDISLYAGGITWADSEYDPKLRQIDINDELLNALISVTHLQTYAATQEISIVVQQSTPAKRTVVKTPQWQEWKHTPHVRVWQACALSLNIEPHSMQPSPYGSDYESNSSSNLHFLPESFPAEDSKEEFELRQRVLLANLPNRKFFSPGILSMDAPNKCGVDLLEFATWATSIVAWEGLPPELVALTQKPEKQATLNTDTTAETYDAVEPPEEARPVTTKEIAKAFPPPKGRRPENWKRTLSDPPQWMKDARTFSGRKGTTALWNPAMFAVCMVSEKHISKETASNIVKRYFSDWLTDWENREAHLQL